MILYILLLFVFIFSHNKNT